MAALRCSVGAGPAVSLQNPEGQDLIFLRLAVDAVLFGPFGFVENEIVFQNPEERRMEGRFSFSLPVGPAGPAAPSRFAMQIEGRLMEGEVVNRSKAQSVYREILHEARDPALLEQSQGNVFTARVFPIEPRAVVRLILSYAILAPLRGSHRTLVLPLAGLPEIHEFTFAAAVSAFGSTSFGANCSLPGFGQVPGVEDPSSNTIRFVPNSSMKLTPATDAVLDVWELGQSIGAFSVDGGKLVSSFVVGDDTVVSSSFDALRQFAPPVWIVYIDTSASTADASLVRLPLISALLEAMPSSDVQVFAFDIEVVEVRALGPKDSTIGSTVQSALEDRLPLGATDLEMLMEHLEGQTNSSGGHGTVGVLILSDMIATANERAAMKLGQMLTPNPGRVVEIGVMGTKFDSSAGGAIAAAGYGRVVRIPLTSQDLPTVVADAWSEFTRPLGRHATPEVSSGWAWPLAASDLHEGDELIVFSGGGDGLTLDPPWLEIGSGNASATLIAGPIQAASAAFSSMLSREVDRARLELLESERQLSPSAAEARSIEYEMVQLSEQSRVLCPHTALLVLETDEDYARFGIAQDSLSPVLVVTGTGVQLVSRSDMSLPALPDPVPIDPVVVPTPNSSVNESASCDDLNSMVCLENADDGDFALNEETGAVYSDTGTQANSGRSTCPMWLVVVLALLACQTGSNWVDLEEDAEATLANQPSPPEDRLRETATAYAGALWTKRRASELRGFCAGWIAWDPANGLAFEYLGKAAGHLGQARTALRAATSIAEVAPRDSEQLLRASWLALSLDLPDAPAWAQRFAQRSLEERSDNPNVYRALAMSSWHAGDYAAAADAYALGLGAEFHDRYGDVQRVLREEAAIFLRSLEASQQAAPFQSYAEGALKAVDVNEGRGIGLLITMSWLTDANDVDLHVVDPNGEECYYSNPSTSWGLRLYSDQTQGLGPEVVALQGRKPGSYTVGVKYFSAGAMGASRGTVIIRQLSEGVPVGEPTIEVFTLPTGKSGVLPVATVVVK